MCTVLFAWQHHPDWPLIVAANRDEMRARPTDPARFWRDAPGVYGGRDALKAGTWLGMSRAGRFAAVTNVREPPRRGSYSGSRGGLAAAHLRGTGTAEVSAKAVSGPEFGPYNLLFGDGEQLWWASNRSDAAPCQVVPGVHGLSNAALDTPWPKVRRGVEALREVVSAARPDPGQMFALLADRTVPPDEQLPDTGFGLPRERLLAPIFIDSRIYGTRASTVVMVRRDGLVHFEERRFQAKAEPLGTTVAKWWIRP
jgi:uncharacterized protein with NRDE domain